MFLLEHFETTGKYWDVDYLAESLEAYKRGDITISDYHEVVRLVETILDAEEIRKEWEQEREFLTDLELDGFLNELELEDESSASVKVQKYEED